MDSDYAKLNSDLLLGSSTCCNIRFYQLHLEVLVDLRTACNDLSDKTINVAFDEMEIRVAISGRRIEVQEEGITKEKIKTIGIRIDLTRPIKPDPRNNVLLSPDGCLSVIAAWK